MFLYYIFVTQNTMKKITSILILALLLLPDLSHSVSTFFGHSHDICTEDGIHSEEINSECITCIVSTNNFTDTNQLFKTQEILIKDKESLFNYDLVVYHSSSTFKLYGRAPPIMN